MNNDRGTEINNSIKDLLIKKILREIKLSQNDRGMSSYRLASKIKKIIEEEIK